MQCIIREYIKDGDGNAYRITDETIDRFREVFLSLPKGNGSHFFKKGCRVVALDISNYLNVSRLYLKDVYFDRIFADMHDIPFIDNAFDIVFGSAVLHHSKKLRDIFFEIRRVLKHRGKLVLIADDYITKHENKCSKDSFKLRLAYFFKKT